MQYRREQGSLNVGMRVEVVGGQIMSMIATYAGWKQTDGRPYQATDFMPHVAPLAGEHQTQPEPLTPEQVMGALMRASPNG